MRAFCAAGGFFVCGLLVVFAGEGAERFQAFDADPGWDGRNNRAISPEPREVRQDFGYSRSQSAGGAEPGEVGGLVHPAAEPAYYARQISAASFSDRLTASGKLACTGRHFHALVGFFNADTLGGWRTPNTIVVRLYGRGDVFYAYVEQGAKGFTSIPSIDSRGRPRLRQRCGASAYLARRQSARVEPCV